VETHVFGLAAVLRAPPGRSLHYAFAPPHRNLSTSFRHPGHAPWAQKSVTPTHLRKIKHLTCHATRFKARHEGFLRRSLGWHQSLMPLRSRRIFGGLPGDKSFNVPSPGLERRTRLVGEVMAFRRCRGVLT
jgi:hypothetical protein